MNSELQKTDNFACLKGFKGVISGDKVLLNYMLILEEFLQWQAIVWSIHALVRTFPPRIIYIILFSRSDLGFFRKPFSMDAEMKNTKSPIKDLPVRQAGQALREKLSILVNEEWLFYFIVMMCLFMVLVIKWAERFSQPSSPWLWSILFLISVVVFAVKFRRTLKEVRTLKLGLAGEEAVGQYLEEKLRPLGCQVLHDIPFDGFNIDHVIIGQGGVYVIETKTRSKPERGPCEITYDGESVTVGGFAPDRDPIIQAKAGARTLYELLESSTGKKFNIKPVVLYPGWFVKSMPSNVEVWVLNEKALPSFIGNTRQNLPPEDVSLITYHLKRYIISKTQERKNKS